jgi:hypothetical protein
MLYAWRGEDVPGEEAMRGSFEDLCRFFTALHEVAGKPEGEFPRMDPR